MNNQESLKKVIQAVNSQKKFPALQLVKANPEAAAVISKLFKPRDPGDFDLKDKQSYYNLNQGQIQAISDSIKNRINDNKNILQLFPDIELAIQILISSVLSPKDMVSTSLIYKAKDILLPAELTLKLHGIIETHLDVYYKFKDEMQEILRDTLFESGSYVKAVIPEGILDEVINQNSFLSTEALTEIFTAKGDVVNLGILGNPGEPSNRSALESFFNQDSVSVYNPKLHFEDDESLQQALENVVEVTDNFRLLKMPNVINAVNQSKLKNKLRTRRSNRLATEANSTKTTRETKVTDIELAGLMYKSNQIKSDEFVVIPGRNNAKRKSIGRPLVMKLPSESVIPVYIPGDESKHIGYFVLIDIDGNPVTLANSQDSVNALNGLTGLANNQSGQSLSSLLIQKAKKNLTNADSVPTLDQITKVYTNILEKDLVERLRNGLYKTNVTVSNNNEIYRVMLARALANQYTRLVYIPAELVTYYAFKHFDNGVGKSYLDNIKVLCSLRAILLFAKVMAMTKNSIAITHVNMTLDPNDPDPQKTIEVATHDIVKMRQQYFPLGINSPVDLVDWIQRAGFEFSFEGHPGLPQTKFDFETKNLQHTIPESELDENLRKQTYMAFGLSPEVVDNGYSSEFATTVISNNILFSKRVLQIQDMFTKHLSDSGRKIVINDTLIMDELIATLKENEDQVQKFLTDEEKEAYTSSPDNFLEDLLERFIESMCIDLPKPDITSIETQMAAFDQYVESLDKTLDAWISSEVVTSDIAGEISSNIDSIKSILKNYFIRQWMSKNGFMTELNDIVTADEDGEPTLDIYQINQTHLEGLIKSATKFIAATQALREAANKDLENMNVEAGTMDTSSDTESDTGGDEFGADMDFGDLGGDIGGEEVPPEEETPTEETPTEEPKE